jgi:hypothetical protein
MFPSDDMTEELQQQLLAAKDVGDVVSAVSKVCQSYGEVDRWTFSKDRERRTLRFFIQLREPKHHQELAKKLHGKVVGDEICFEIAMPTGALAQSQGIHGSPFKRPADTQHTRGRSRS